MTVLLYLLGNILFLAGFTYWWWRRQTQPFFKLIFWPALILKLMGGLLVGWLYQHYLSGGDTFVYQKQAQILSNYAGQDPGNYLNFILTGKYQSVYLYDAMKYRGYSNSFFVVLLLHFLNFITGSSYYLNGLYFSLFSFFGCWQLTTILAKVFPATKVAAILAFLFFPSVVFWSSGILKETVLVGSSAWLLAVVLQFIYLKKKRSIWLGVQLLLAAFILFKIRFYFAVAYFPLLAGFAFIELFTQKKYLAEQKKFIFYGVALLILGGLASFLHEAVSLSYFFQELIKSYQSTLMLTRREAFINLPNLQPNFMSLLYYAPKTISSVIFRPFIGEINTVAYVLAGLENLLVFLLTVSALFTFQKNKSVLPGTFVLSLIIYALLLAALIGFSTANLGSVSRYKVAFMPFLVYLLLQTGANQNALLQLEEWFRRHFAVYTR